MRITSELRRPARRSVALLVGALLLLTPAVVLANHQFPDVAASHPFHSQISAIAKAGITAGFPDGGYHPSDPVTRQAMAAFMQRGFGRVGLAVGDAPATGIMTAPAGNFSGSAVPIRRLTIDVPGASNSFSPNQLVLLHGQVTLFAGMGPANGCRCEFTTSIRDITTGAQSIEQLNTFESALNDGAYYSFDVQGLFVAAPGLHTFELWAAVNFRANNTPRADFTITPHSSLSAMTFPFGPTGGNTP